MADKEIGGLTSASALDGTELALVVQGGNSRQTTTGKQVSEVTHSATGKTTPADNDELPLVDSAASNVLKKLLWSNVKATLKTYFDTLYASTGSGISDGDKGDITVSSSGAAWTIDNDVVTNAKSANMAQSTIKGRAASAGTGDPTDLSVAQVVAIIGDTDGTLAANSDALVATQKATKTYVDAMVAGLSWKQAVRAATTANGTLASAFANGSTIDGVTLATGDRILVKNQSTGAENGIYTVNASGAPTRSTDADSGAELVNASVYVSEGTTLADTQWTCSTNAPITVGSTSLTFTQLSAGAGFSPASTTEALTGTDTTKGVTPDALAALWEKGADTASATTVSLGEGGFFHITGTTTITDIDWATAKDGRIAFVIFDGILTLTHNATTLKLPGNANITTAAGDRAIFVQDNSDNVICIAYIRADGTPLLSTILRSDVSSNLTKGFTSTTYDNGTKSSGTFTPDPANGAHQKATFNGALTLAPPSTGTGDATTVTLTVTNGASAGAITTSGFTKKDGSFDTTSGNKFKCFMTVDSVASYLNIVAMQ